MTLPPDLLCKGRSSSELESEELELEDVLVADMLKLGAILLEMLTCFVDSGAESAPLSSSVDALFGDFETEEDILGDSWTFGLLGEFLDNLCGLLERPVLGEFLATFSVFFANFVAGARRD